MPFTAGQRLNDWVDMLDQVYGRTQNYAKTDYELMSHLTEVCGAFGKYLIKKRDPVKAQTFLPKMFAWAVALLKKVRRNEADLEEILLTKVPRVCPYCCGLPCTCDANQEKPQLDENKVRGFYLRNAAKQKRTIDDYQLMYRLIYETTWGVRSQTSNSDAVCVSLLRMFSRLIEEVSELAEAMRFFHLYPSNFDNEIADYLAWWFALVSSIHHAFPGETAPFLASEVLWSAYPGRCIVCDLERCECRAGPVRELLSKPALNDLERIDGLTQAANRLAFEDDVRAIANGEKPFSMPAACVWIDLDLFKKINDENSHAVGDQALTHLVTTARQKVRPRDRLYRVGGDEFAILCPDLSKNEAEGMMSRIANALKTKPLIASSGTSMKSIQITLSVGIAECTEASALKSIFEAADRAAIKSKNDGRDRITITSASSVLPAQAP